jgi:soluble lytic murein transglycosylase-like protein
MNYASMILAAAKAAKVSGILLLAICSHESGGFTQNYSPMDHGSPSFGSCQIKLDTAKFLGFNGNPEELNKPKINFRYAALYLQYQQRRYGDNWVQVTSAYNAGSFLPSRYNSRTCPRNLRYIRLVQNKLPEEFKERLNCGEVVAENP